MKSLLAFAILSFASPSFGAYIFDGECGDLVKKKDNGDSIKLKVSNYQLLVGSDVDSKNDLTFSKPVKRGTINHSDEDYTNLRLDITLLGLAEINALLAKKTLYVCSITLHGGGKRPESAIHTSEISAQDAVEQYLKSKSLWIGN